MFCSRMISVGALQAKKQSASMGVRFPRRVIANNDMQFRALPREAQQSLQDESMRQVQQVMGQRVEQCTMFGTDASHAC